jgi:purine-nucleoside phosphorylase
LAGPQPKIYLINLNNMITPELVTQTCAFLQKHTGIRPLAGIVLGTGMNALIEYLEQKQSIAYADIPNFPVATVSFHKGELLFGYIEGVPVVVLQGRFHYYEGYSMQQLTFPVRVLHGLGIRYLLLSNAAGGMNPTFKKGDLVLIDDHINLLPDNPLRGLGNAFGNYFVDMSAPYAPPLLRVLEETFRAQQVPVKRGIYVSVMGPNLETRAEYRWLRSTGADMVGMSTVPEVIVANQLGLSCAAISVITDECDPDHLQPVNIEEIIAVAGKADAQLSKVLAAFIRQLPELQSPAVS